MGSMVTRRSVVLHCLRLFLVCAMCLLPAWPGQAQVVPPAEVDLYDDGLYPDHVRIATNNAIHFTNYGEAMRILSCDDPSLDISLYPDDTYNVLFMIAGTYTLTWSSDPPAQAVVDVYPSPMDIPVDLGLGAWVEEEPAAGQEAQIWLDYANYSEDAIAFDAVLTATLDSRAAFVSATREGAPITPTVAGNTLTFALGPLGPSAGETVGVRVRLASDIAPGTALTLARAGLRATNLEMNPDDNDAILETAVAGPDLWVGLGRADEAVPLPGAVLEYAAEYANNGALPAPDAEVVVTLPAALTLVGASREGVPITPTAQPDGLHFALGTLPPWEWNSLLLRTRLAADALAGDEFTVRARVRTSAMEVFTEDNEAFEVGTVVRNEPNLYVAVESSSDGEVGGEQLYGISYGNAGPQPARGAVLTGTLSMPLTDLDASADVTPTIGPDGRTLTFALGDLPEEGGHGWVDISGRLAAAGTLTATAEIRSASREGNPRDNRAAVSDEIVWLRMPGFVGPDGATVGPRPVLFGVGSPGATLTLQSWRGDVATTLGTVEVDEGGLWEYEVPTPLAAGWYWFTGRQSRGERTSEMAGVGAYVREGLGVDPSAYTVYGERLGGINQPYGWVSGAEYRLGARITACPAPTNVVLKATYFTADGLMTGFDNIPADEPAVAGEVSFAFTAPPTDTEFELMVAYSCPAFGGGAGVAPGAVGPSGALKDAKDCFLSLGASCSSPDDDPPPPPPSACKGCTPVPRTPHRPRTFDPDGYVYDAAQVAAGATMERSLITTAEVTCLQRQGDGTWAAWNAWLFDQRNPQRTDPTYDDLVLRAGYFSFLVPPGAYLLEAVAPGFQPYRSPILVVTNIPVTHNIPLGRVGWAGAAPEWPEESRVYLPVLRR